MPETPTPPAALVAFLRGVERRAALFAELQAGDPEVGDLAVATAMRQFQAEAAPLAMADWPRRFWQRLINATSLRQPAAGRWPAELQHLGTLAVHDRLALLSRLAAGLPEDEALEVLAIDQLHYRSALAAACPRDAAGAADARAWRELAEAIQSRMKELSPDRMARLARLRDHALQPPAAPRHSAPTSSPPPRLLATTSEAREGGRWRRVLWIVVVVLCCLGLAATFVPRDWWPQSLRPAEATTAPQLGLSEEPDIRIETLPPADSPAARLQPEAAVATHPDLPMLRDADFAVSQHADLLAWYAAGAHSDSQAAEQAPTPGDPNQQGEARDTTF
ncbi:MAG TPA: hypothetical protein VM469_00630 [Pseudoxanthomonas sp.]|nr:hypothetical protein [Pseudoxanthomonas sp.]